MKIKTIIPSLAFLLGAGLFFSCNSYDDEIVKESDLDVYNWNDVAEKSTQALLSWFWNDNGYFNYNAGVSDGPDYNYWPQAHAMDAVIDAYLRSGKQQYADFFPVWFEGIKQKSGGGYWNNFYDDMSWIALTMTRLYETTREERYLNQAREMWADIRGGWNDRVLDGGIAWTHDRPLTRNTCTNGPAALLGARLYTFTHDDDDLAWAKKIYEWERNTFFNPGTGFLSDGMRADGSFESFALTYTEGLFMAAGQALYNITHEDCYLRDARKAAAYTITNLIDAGNNVLRDEGTGDNGLFKGIFMHYLAQLILDPAMNADEHAAYKKRFAAFLKHNSLVLWTRGVDPDVMLFSPNWTRPADTTTQLTTQTSAALTLEARALYEKNK